MRWASEQASRLDEAIAGVLALVAERTGLALTREQRALVRERVRRMMEQWSVSDPARLRACLAADATAFDALVAELTIGETYFFREPGQLAFVRAEVIPALLRRREPGVPIRAWSAGCASGEEPYTIAILFHELGLATRARVLGTDIARPRLAAAREARYGEWSLRGVDDGVICRHFRAHGGRFELAPEICALVWFDHLNLADRVAAAAMVAPRTMDLVLCRNVLIYLDAATIREVAALLIDSLSDDGWLILGASDPPLAELVACEVVVTGAGVAYRRPRLADTPPRRASVSSSPPRSAAAGAGSSTGPTPAVALVHEPAPAGRAEELAAQARRHYAAGDYAHAAATAGECLSLDDSGEAVWILQVRALGNVGSRREAAAACAAALDRHPMSAELSYLHAVLAAEAGRHAEAVDAARRALYLDRGLTVAHLMLGVSLAYVGDATGARRSFGNAERLLAALPPDAPVPGTDGELAAPLAAVARTRLALLDGGAA